MIFLTGGTGFVGSHIASALRDEGRPVRCLVRNPSRAGALDALGCELARGDVTDVSSLRESLTGCDAVIHLVAIIAGKPQDFERVMEQGTRNVVDAAKDAGVRRFVLMSALGVSAATKDLVPYYHAKWEMERTVETSGLEHVIFRPSFVFGRDGGVMPQFTRLVRLLPVTPIVGPGTQRIQPIDVDDVAAFFARAVDLPEAAGHAYEIGGPEILTWNELWARLQDALGKRRPTLHLPFGLMRAQAAFLERLPKPPLTRDQLTMLAAGDNTCDVGPALRTFGLTLRSLDEQIRRSL
jgi:NADH dehydrogenase